MGAIPGGPRQEEGPRPGGPADDRARAAGGPTSTAVVTALRKHGHEAAIPPRWRGRSPPEPRRRHRRPRRVPREADCTSLSLRPCRAAHSRRGVEAIHPARHVAVLTVRSTAQRSPSGTLPAAGQLTAFRADLLCGSVEHLRRHGRVRITLDRPGVVAADDAAHDLLVDLRLGVVAGG